MEQQNINLQPIGNQPEENEISIMEILFKYIKYWKWFVVSLLIAMALAFLYFRYTVPVYNVTSSVILKDQKNQRGGAARGLGGFGSLDGLELMGGISNVENETYVIRSKTAVRTVIDKLNLHTSYIVQGRISSNDLYTESPFIIAMDGDGLDTLQQRIDFSAQLNKDNSITVKGTIGDKVYDTKLTNLPALLNTPRGIISFMLREGAKPYYNPLQISIMRPASTVNAYRSNLTVQPATKTSSVLNLTLKTSYPNKGKDFLNTLVDVYNFQTIEDKNLEATNTKIFINERLDIIDKELSSAEGSVEQYKRSQGMTDLEADLMQSLQQSSQYEQQLVKAETQLSIVNSLNEYVKNPDNQGKPVPSNIGVQDPTLAATTNEYNKLLAERERLSKSMQDNNPVMQKLDEQINALRKGINSSISSVREGLAIERRNIGNQAKLYSGKIGDVPRQERQFTEIAREQQIKASLYLLLLQKREENALALAATANSAKVLDEAYREGMVHPKKPIILLATLLFGLLLPVGIIYLMDLIQYKIRSRGDVDRLSMLPVLGEIPSHDVEADGNIAVSENSTTELDEAFRMIRTNLMMSLNQKEDKVVVFTSTIPSEGKTFAALNTAISLALLGKKVLLLGLDFRLPRISQYLGIDNDSGLTNYLSGYEDNVMKLVRTSSISKHLSVLSAGPIPPNPAELLSRDRLDAAVETLRPEFDYIIVDSAPVSLVSDTLIINRIADANVYLCRANFSSKASLKFANNLMTSGKLKNMLLLINDVSDFHSGYGYGYGYGYGHKGKAKKKKVKN
ncbi:MAG: polysaccharide biosynthesis tyrosine autokinase [Dysgonamonadaceae bacterium]|nr:polysaccharide biosynthesis tyrosine autokinase [Dysgonamonadaceae bacterium]